MDKFIEEASKVVPRAHTEEKKYLQRIFAGPCHGHIKKPIYDVVMIDGTDGSKTEILFARELFLLCLKAGTDAQETEVASIQYVEVATIWKK